MPPADLRLWKCDACGQRFKIQAGKSDPIACPKCGGERQARRTPFEDLVDTVRPATVNGPRQASRPEAVDSAQSAIAAGDDLLEAPVAPMPLSSAKTRDESPRVPQPRATSGAGFWLLGIILIAISLLHFAMRGAQRPRFHDDNAHGATANALESLDMTLAGQSYLMGGLASCICAAIRDRGRRA